MFERFVKTDAYYEDQLYDTSYSTDPTGAELSIDRLVNGTAAYWKTQTRCPTTPRKKKLVITDWKENRSPEFFNQLIDEGFELYVCQGTIKLTSKYELQADLVEINPTSKKEVIQTMANQGVPADQVLVLDYFLMNQLAYTDIQEPLHIINFDDLSNKNAEFFRSLLDSIEKGSRVGIVISNITNINGIIEKYIEQFLEKSKHIFYLSSDIDYFERFFTSIPSLDQTLESLTIYQNNNRLDLNIEFIKKLINLKELNLLGLSISIKSLNSLLAHSPNLVKLNLSGCKKIYDSNEELQFENLKKLKKLILSCSPTITGSSLFQHCFEHCHNLEELGLIDFSKEFQLKEDLNELKKLNLNSTMTTVKSLNSLFAHCPNLETLNLDSEILNTNNEELQFENLKKLKELDLSSQFTTIKHLNSLFAHCPNLVKLDLDMCKNIEDSSEELQLKESLKELKNLSLLSLSIAMKHLNSLLAHSPNLVKLNLSGCENINDTSEELQINENLEELKELDLSFSSITMKSLNRLLAHCPNLEKLDLRVYKNINDIEELQIENLKKLKELDLSFSSITMKSLNRLLAHCSDLVKLDLRSYKNINDIEELQIENLKKLKELDLGRSSITRESLISLLKYCPNLVILDLTGCFFREDDQLAEALSKIKKVKGRSNIGFSSYAQPSTSIASRSDRISTSSGRHRLDKNTQYDKNKVLDVNQYFSSISNGQPDPDPTAYRLRVLDQIEKKNSEVCLDKPEPALKKCKIETTSIDKIQTYCQQYENEPDYFYGQINLSLAQGDKYSLPSLSTIDEIKSLSSNVPVDLWYCEAENLYYVSLQGNVSQNAKISYIVHTPTEQPPPFPEHIQELINFYHFEHPASGAGKLDGIDGNSSDTEILNAIKNQKKGSCRHRTACFINDIASMSEERLRGIKVRAVFNDCHAYPEISYNDGSYYRADLGGYETELNIKKLEKLNNKKSDLKNEKMNNTEENKNVKQPTVALQLHSKPKNGNSFSKNILLPDTVTSFDKYCPWLLEQTEELLPQERNALITFDNADQLEQFNVAMLRHLVKEKNQYYYLDNLDDVKRKDIAFDNDSHEGSGDKIIDSNLISYINQAKSGDVLIVNWSDYKPDHVGYNTLLDKERKFNNIPIRDGVVIINLLALAKTSSMREDFYSRIGIRTKLPNFHPHAIMHSNSDIASISSAAVSSVANKSVDIYGDNDWEKYLLGTVNIQGEKLALQKGALIQALENNCSQLIIQNAPNLRMFRLFCEEVLQKRSFILHGKTYTLPDNFTFKYETKTHDLSSGYSIIPLQDNEFHYSLNAKTLPYYFATYQCQGSHLFQQDGWLKQNSERSIRVLVTESFQESQWARLLDNVRTHDCHLQIILAPGVTLPPAMSKTCASDKKRVVRFPLLPLDESVKNKKIAVVISQDMDLTAEKMACTFPAEILSVTKKMSFADLIEGITRDHNLDEETDTNKLHLRFKSMTGVLLEKLRQGNVILKGTLSPDLRAKLETLFCSEPYLWVNGAKEENIPGRLIVVTEDDKTFPFTQRYQDHVTKEDRWHLLEKKFSQPLIEKLKRQIQQQNRKMTNYSYSQLTAMLQQLQKNEAKNVFKSFQRLDSNPMTALKKEKKVGSEKDKDINEKRLAKINRYLTHSPYVFITGPSGVGKSSFIKTVLKERANLYVGLDNVSQWAQQPLTNGKRNILFIDEANLEADGSFDIFEGLFGNPPGIVINQKFCPLTDNHKIIFAGNFSGTEGRQQHNFFKKHGAVMSFKEYTDDELTQIIEPVLNEALNGTVPPLSEEQRQEAIKIFLKVYHIVNQSLPKPKLTTRNLQMMCLRFALYQQKNMAENISALAGMAVYDEIWYPSLDEKTRNKLEQDCHVSPPTAATKDYAFNQFIVTDSRKNTLRLLDDHFAIRELKLNNKITAGISGFLLEGPSGIGKSEMAIEYLRAQNYQNGFEATSERVDSNHRYYHITPTNPVVMKEILVKAFHEGAVVIIDEFNTLPLEKELNSLMSEGTDPQGEKANKEGFFVIATQNPISFAGRKALSDPLDKRVHKIELPTYPDHELIEILLKKGLKESEATDLVNEYNDQRKKASHSQDLPTPRGLFNYADRTKDQRKRSEILVSQNLQTGPSDVQQTENPDKSSGTKSQVAPMSKVMEQTTSQQLQSGSPQLTNYTGSPAQLPETPAESPNSKDKLTLQPEQSIFRKKWIHVGLAVASFAVVAIGVLSILSGVGILPGVMLVATAIGLSAPLLSQLAIAIGSTIICSWAVAIVTKLGKSLFDRIKNAMDSPATGTNFSSSQARVSSQLLTHADADEDKHPVDSADVRDDSVVYPSPLGSKNTRNPLGESVHTNYPERSSLQ